MVLVSFVRNPRLAAAATVCTEHECQFVVWCWFSSLFFARRVFGRFSTRRAQHRWQNMNFSVGFYCTRTSLMEVWHGLWSMCVCALVPYLKTVENLKNVSILLHFLHVSGFELWHPLLPVWFWIFHRWRCARIKVSFASSVSVLHFCILVNQKQILIMANDKSNLQRKEDKPLDDGKSLSAFTFFAIFMHFVVWLALAIWCDASRSHLWQMQWKWGNDEIQLSCHTPAEPSQRAIMDEST